LIDPDGKQLGVKPLPEALAIARQMDLDLVEVAPDANPPVCRIMDYNRFKYESAQRAKESRKKATSTSIKEMKYRPKIGSGDFTTKTRQVSRFLEEGHKVKVTIMFRGREVSHPELGMKILDDLAEQVSSVAKVEAAPKLDGRNMVMVLAPDKRARQAARKTADLGQEASVAPEGTSAGSANGTEGEPDSVAEVTTQPVTTEPVTTGLASTEPASTEPGTTRPAPKAPASTRTAAPAPTVTVSGGSPASGGGSPAANGAPSPRREPAPKHEPAGVAALASGASRSPVEDLA
jgi:translation initiation factor IF-3